MHHRQLPSDLAKTRKFKPPPEAVTTPFVRIEDATVPFEPYASVEIDVSEVERVELDLSKVAPIDDTLPFALDSGPIAKLETSEPYELIEMRLSLPAVAEPLVPRPRSGTAPMGGSRIRLALVIALVMICAFAFGFGVVFAL